jgi:hypothetical protein
MSAYTLVAVLTIGGLLALTGAADARRQVRHTIRRHATTRHEYSGFERRADWQALNRSGLAVRS